MTTTTPAYHWTPASQRAFLECLAETGSIAQACDSVLMSRRSAYNLRFRRDGAGFRLGWEAAILIARDCLSDELLARAIDGMREESERNPETGRMVRIKRDSRLGMSLLARLDRMAEAGGPASHARARLVSSDFEACLDMIESGGDVEDFVLACASQCELEAETAPPRGEIPANRGRKPQRYPAQDGESGPSDRYSNAARALGGQLLAENEGYLTLNRQERRRLASRAAKTFRHDAG